MPNELGMELTQQEFKFDYSFTTLIFATLALSIQFSPGMGHKMQWLLIISWVLLFISAIFGGIRIIKKNYYLHINVLRNEALEKGKIQLAKSGDGLLEKTNKEALKLFKYRQWLFLIGIVCNLIFAAANYLEKSPNPPNPTQQEQKMAK